MIQYKPWLSVALLIGALLSVIAIQRQQIASEHARITTLAMQRANGEAGRDTTHLVNRENPAIARLLGDSVRLYRKQVVQRTQERDAIDRALDEERVMRYELSVQLDSLHRQQTVVAMEGPAGARSAAFDVRQAPFTVHADVALPAPPDSGQFSVRVALDPIRVGARVLCAPADSFGIRRASVAVKAPPWAKVGLDTVEQAPGICPSPALDGRGKGAVRFVPLLVGAGRFVGRSGTDWGVLVGFGWSPFPR